MGFFDDIDFDDYITDFNPGPIVDIAEDPGILAPDYLPVPDDVGGLFDLGGTGGGLEYGEWGGDWDTAAQELFGAGGADDGSGISGGLFEGIEDWGETVLTTVDEPTDWGILDDPDVSLWTEESTEPLDWGSVFEDTDDYYDVGNCWTTDCWDYDPLPYTTCDCGFEDDGWFGTDQTYEELLGIDPSVADPFLATTVDVVDDTISVDDLVDVTPGILEDTIDQTIDDSLDVDDMVTMAQDDIVTMAAPDDTATPGDSVDVDDMVTMATPDVMVTAAADELPDIEDDLVAGDFASMPAVELSDVATEDLADAAAGALSDSLSALGESLDDDGGDLAAVALDEPTDDLPLFAADDEAEPSYSGNAFPPDETLDQP